MLTNVRKPEQNLGDLKALVGALNTGERKVQGMLAKFGRERLRRRAGGRCSTGPSIRPATSCASIPDGDYFFSDYADEDGVDGNPCRLALTLTIKGDEAVLDFTGTDPQLTSSLNVPTGSDPRHTLLLVGVYYVLYTLEPAAPAECRPDAAFHLHRAGRHRAQSRSSRRRSACAVSLARACAA